MHTRKYSVLIGIKANQRGHISLEVGKSFWKIKRQIAKPRSCLGCIQILPKAVQLRAYPLLVQYKKYNNTNYITCMLITCNKFLKLIF